MKSWSIIAGVMTLALLILGCGGLQKSAELIEAEQAYLDARQNEQILRYAPDGLKRVGEALARAAAVDNTDDMSSLTYVGKTRLKTVEAMAARKAAIGDVILLDWARYTGCASRGRVKRC